MPKYFIYVFHLMFITIIVSGGYIKGLIYYQLATLAGCNNLNIKVPMCWCLK